MRLSLRSKSCTIKPNQTPPSRRLSMSNIKNRSPSTQSKEMSLFRSRIVSYIQKRSDIEIINFYQEYKQEFFRKSISLQQLLYDKPDMRHSFLSEENSHFFRGLQQTLLRLFRNGAIVPGEYRNMRSETVELIEKWVFSWIQRQIQLQNSKDQYLKTVNDAQTLVDQIQSFNKQVQSEKSLF